MLRSMLAFLVVTCWSSLRGLVGMVAGLILLVQWLSLFVLLTCASLVVGMSRGR